MHGLIGRALECFLADAHGAALRDAALGAAGLPPDGFRSTRHYPSQSVHEVVRAAAGRLGLPHQALLADLGTWIVSGARNEALRRLVRFGGSDFRGFLHSLEDLPARGRLAVPDLALPRISVEDRGARYDITTDCAECGAGWVVSGVLRGMADDYGVLAVVEHRGTRRTFGACTERITIEIADGAHSAGRRFDLALPLAGAA